MSNLTRILIILFFTHVLVFSAMAQHLEQEHTFPKITGYVSVDTTVKRNRILQCALDLLNSLPEKVQLPEGTRR